MAPRLHGTRFAFVAGDAEVAVTCPWGNRLRVHAPDAARSGGLRLGMPYVEIDVAPGSAARIAGFYRQVLGAHATHGEDAQGAHARVTAGPDASLLFRETRRDLPPYDGHHVQVSVADFSAVHRRLVERGLVTEESSAGQYRFQDIVDAESGERLATLEHEVRSLRHPLYGRTLVNRDPAVTTGAYAAGREAAMWRLPPG